MGNCKRLKGVACERCRATRERCDQSAGPDVSCKGCKGQGLSCIRRPPSEKEKTDYSTRREASLQRAQERDAQEHEASKMSGRRGHGAGASGSSSGSPEHDQAGPSSEIASSASPATELTPPQPSSSSRRSTPTVMASVVEEDASNEEGSESDSQNGEDLIDGPVPDETEGPSLEAVHEAATVRRMTHDDGVSVANPQPRPGSISSDPPMESSTEPYGVVDPSSPSASEYSEDEDDDSAGASPSDNDGLPAGDVWSPYRRPPRPPPPSPPPESTVDMITDWFMDARPRGKKFPGT